jgi:DNA-directed RNA polymerase subunit RPC12/RpoP
MINETRIEKNTVPRQTEIDGETAINVTRSENKNVSTKYFRCPKIPNRPSLSGLSQMEPKEGRIPDIRDYEICSGCGATLLQENLIGFHKGSVFVIKGYNCPGCGLQVRWDPRTKKMKNQPVPFDWKRIVRVRAGERSTLMVGGQ